GRTGLPCPHDPADETKDFARRTIPRAPRPPAVPPPSPAPFAPRPPRPKTRPSWAPAPKSNAVVTCRPVPPRRPTDSAVPPGPVPAGQRRRPSPQPAPPRRVCDLCLGAVPERPGSRRGRLRERPDGPARTLAAHQVGRRATRRRSLPAARPQAHAHPGHELGVP